MPVLSRVDWAATNQHSCCSSWKCTQAHHVPHEQKTTEQVVHILTPCQPQHPAAPSSGSPSAQRYSHSSPPGNPGKHGRQGQAGPPTPSSPQPMDRRRPNVPPRANEGGGHPGSRLYARPREATSQGAKPWSFSREWHGGNRLACRQQQQARQLATTPADLGCPASCTGRGRMGRPAPRLPRRCRRRCSGSGGCSQCQGRHCCSSCCGTFRRCCWCCSSDSSGSCPRSCCVSHHPCPSC